MQTHHVASSATGTNIQDFSQSNCKICSVDGANTNATGRYIKVYHYGDGVYAVPAGGWTVILTLYLPPVSVKGGVFSFNFKEGIECRGGGGFLLTTGVVDNDVAGVSSGDIVGLTIGYDT